MDQIDGFSPAAGDKLKAIGIEKLMDLHMMGKTPEGRVDITSKTGLSLDDINRCVDQAVAIRKAEQAAKADAAAGAPTATAAPAAPAKSAAQSAPSPASPAQPAAQAAPTANAPAQDASASPAPDMTNRLDKPISAGTSSGTLFGKFREGPHATNSLSALIQKAQAGSRRSPQPTQGGPGVGKTVGDILALLLSAGGSARPGGPGGTQINWPSIGQIKGVDSARAQKLQSAGSANAADLLRLTQTPQAHKDLASKMGVSESMVLLWLGDVINSQAPQAAKALGINLMEIVDLEELDTLIEETEIYDEEYEEVETYGIDEMEYEEEEEDEDEEDGDEEEDEEEDKEEEEEEEEEAGEEDAGDDDE